MISKSINYVFYVGTKKAKRTRVFPSVWAFHVRVAENMILLSNTDKEHFASGWRYFIRAIFKSSEIDYRYIISAEFLVLWGLPENLHAFMKFVSIWSQKLLNRVRNDCYTAVLYIGLSLIRWISYVWSANLNSVPSYVY